MPSESAAELQSKVMEKVLLFGSSLSDKLIVNKLCLSMSAVILHTLDKCPDAVTQVISTFQTYHGIPVRIFQSDQYVREILVLSFCKMICHFYILHIVLDFKIFCLSTSHYSTSRVG